MLDLENAPPKGFWTKQIISINPAELNVIAFVSMMDEKHIVSALLSQCFCANIFRYCAHAHSKTD